MGMRKVHNMADSHSSTAQMYDWVNDQMKIIHVSLKWQSNSFFTPQFSMLSLSFPNRFLQVKAMDEIFRVNLIVTSNLSVTPAPINL